MRVNIMFGLGHVHSVEQYMETVRLLQSAIAELTQHPDPMKPKTAIILRDTNGNRVGVIDILEDRT